MRLYLSDTTVTFLDVNGKKSAKYHLAKEGMRSLLFSNCRFPSTGYMRYGDKNLVANKSLNHTVKTYRGEARETASTATFRE